MADIDDFCIVTGKKGRKVRQKQKHSNTKSQIVNEHEYFDLPSFKKRLDNCIQEILMSQFFHTSYDSIISATSVLVHTRPASESRENPRVTSDEIQCASHLTCTSSEILYQNPQLSQTKNTDNVNNSLITSLESVSLSKEELQDIHLLSYGIGNFTTCLIARYQLAYLLAVRNNLGDRCTKCCVYDPVFSSQEKLVLELYNCQVISQNEEGKRVCTAPTVAFLPHCGKALYNNLLWKNLASNNSRGLSLLVLIGNSFSNILERTPKRLLNKTGNYILKLSPYMTEVHLANTFTHKDVFNDLSIHYIPRSQIIAALQDMGENLIEPSYEDDDAEFIGK